MRTACGVAEAGSWLLGQSPVASPKKSRVDSKHLADPRREAAALCVQCSAVLCNEWSG